MAAKSTSQVSKITDKVKTKAQKKIQKVREEADAAKELIKIKEDALKLAEKDAEAAKKIIDTYNKQNEELNELVKLKKYYQSIGQNIDAQTEEHIKKLQSQLILDEDAANKAKDKLEEVKSINDELEKANEQYNRSIETVKNLVEAEVERKNALKQSVENASEYNDTLNSVGNTLGKQNKLYEALQLRQESMGATLRGVSSILDSVGDGQEELKNQTIQAAQGYKQLEYSIASSVENLAKGKITQQEYNDAIIGAYENVDQLISKIDTSTQEGQSLVKILGDARDRAKELASAAEKSKEQFQMMDQVMGQFSGIPAMNEFNQLMKAAKGSSLALKAALFAVGAAASKALFDYFGAPIKVGMKLDHEIQSNKLETAQQVLGLQKEAEFIPQKIGMERSKNAIETANNVNRLTVEAAYSAERAANSFSAQMQQGAASFAAAAKTARFGEKLGPTGYNAAQLNLAGIDPGQISQAMSELATITGKVPTEKLAGDMAVMAKRTGQSTQSIAGLTEYFQRTDNLSADTAVNMVEGMRAMAKASGLDLGNLMQGVAEASEDALSYQIKSAEALTKQVAAAQSIGVNFNKVAKAGQNMVLNYKDSIKAEMQLSAMLGRNVNLSEVRQKMMTGDVTGAMQSLKAQGLDPSQMNMFQQQQLSQALGGMDITTIQKISKGEIKTAADLEAGDAAKEGKGFLQRTTQAQASLAATNAAISANQAIIDAKLSGKITDAYLNSPEYKKYQEAQNQLAQSEVNLNNMIKEALLKSAEYRDLEVQKSQLDQRFNLQNTLLEAGVSVIGGAISTKLLGGLGKKILPSVFGKTSQFAGGSFSAGRQIVANRLAARGATSVAQTAGTSLAGNAARTGTSMAGNIARTGIGTMFKGGAKGLLVNAGKGLLKGGPAGILASITSAVGDAYGGAKIDEGIQEGDKTKVAGGRAIKTGATALEYAGYGAVLGSIVPGIGTAVGGAVGGLVGGIKGIYDNWFSDEAKAQDEQMKVAQEQKRLQEEALKQQQQLSQQLVTTQYDENGNAIMPGAGLGTELVANLLSTIVQSIYATSQMLLDVQSKYLAELIRTVQLGNESLFQIGQIELLNGLTLTNMWNQMIETPEKAEVKDLKEKEEAAKFEIQKMLLEGIGLRLDLSNQKNENNGIRLDIMRNLMGISNSQLASINDKMYRVNNNLLEGLINPTSKLAITSKHTETQTKQLDLLTDVLIDSNSKQRDMVELLEVNAELLKVIASKDGGNIALEVNGKKLGDILKSVDAKSKSFARVQVNNNLSGQKAGGK